MACRFLQGPNRKMYMRGGFKKTSADSERSKVAASAGEESSAKVTTAAKAFRALTAVVVFGIPLVTGAVALISYGVHKAYKRITGIP